MDRVIHDILLEALGPEAVARHALLSAANPANASRELEMQRRIVQLASGELTGLPCERIVAVMGRGHVHAVSARLKLSQGNGKAASRGSN